jgi:hypothetical protein
MKSTTTTEENILCRTHDLPTLQDKYPDWGEYSRPERHHLTAQTPAETVSIHRNITVDGLHESIVDLLNPSSSNTPAVSELALGDGDSPPVSGNTSLNNEVERIAVTETSDRGTSLAVSTFIDTGQANGETIREVGLVDSGGTLLNHALVTPIDKDDETTATIDVTLSFSPNP